MKVCGWTLLLAMVAAPATSADQAVVVIYQDCNAYGGSDPCFESLAAWQTGWGGIDFGAHSPGDLVAADLVAVAQIEGAWSAPDTTPVDLLGWQTDAEHYVSIRTAGNARHDGTPASGYRLATTAPGDRPLFISIAHLRIDGLEIHCSSSHDGHVVYIAPDSPAGVGDIRISHCLVHGNATSSSSGIYNSSCRGEMRVLNSIIFDVGSPGYTAGIQTSAGISYLYNNTIVDTIEGFGIRSGGEVVIAANNLVDAVGEDFYGSFWPGSDFNASSDDTAPGFSSHRNATFTFVNPMAQDFHLATTDQGAANQGRDLSALGHVMVVDDIDSEIRAGAWEIGADEVALAPDSIPPVRFDPAPSGTLPSSTTETEISLSTNEASSCRMDTSPDVAYAEMSTSFDITGGISHQHTVTGLVEEQTYTFYIKCLDASANANSDDLAISFFIASSDAIPPVISGVGVSSVDSYSAVMTWTTDEDATSQVDYGALGRGLRSSPIDTNRVTAHAVVLPDLDADTRYRFQVRSRDIAGNETVSDVVLLDTPPPPGMVFYVDQSHPLASDTGPGTQSEPWATIQHAADTVAPGDSVIVIPGSYGRTAIRYGGAPGQWITFKGSAPPDQGHIDFNAPYDPSNPVQTPGNPMLNAVTMGFDLVPPYGSPDPVAWVRVESFEITAIYDGSTSGRGGVHFSGTDHVQIVGNLLHDLNPDPASYNYIGIRGDSHNNLDVVVKGNTLFRCQGTGISLVGQRWLVEDNELSHGLDNNTDTGAHVGGDSDAMRFFGSDHLIRHNHLHDYLDEEQYGEPHIDAFQTFSVYPDSQFADHIVIEGNVCDNFGQMLMVSDTSEENGTGNKIHHLSFRNNVFRSARANAINGSRADHFQFVNNVVAESNYSGFGLILNPFLEVANNVFYNNGSGSQVNDLESKVGSMWDYNLHFPDFSWPPKQPEYDLHSLFGADPRFINGPEGDYRLQRDSPAVDAGLACSDFNYDVDFMPRPQGTGWDMGAFEHMVALFADGFATGDTSAWSYTLP